MLDQFIALESQVWDALVAGDIGADLKLLAPDFLGVYRSGFAARQEHADQLQAGPTIAWYEIKEARVVVLATDVVLLSYKASFNRQHKHDSQPQESMYVTSIWANRANGWVNVFSQDTHAE